MKDVRQSYILARRGTGGTVRKVSLPQLSRESLGGADNQMSRSLIIITAIAITLSTIACGYTQLRTEQHDYHGGKRSQPITHQLEVEISDRMLVLAKRYEESGRDSLSQAQSDSIDGGIIYLIKKKEKSGLESFTNVEREFLSLVFKRAPKVRPLYGSKQD